MAITFPRELPQRSYFVDSQLEPVEMTVQNPARGATHDVTEIGPTLWRGVWSTRPLNRTEAAEMKAWLTSLRAGMNRFLGWDVRHKYGLAYPNGYGGLTRYGGGTFDGSATLNSATVSTLTISTLPVGFAFRVGDYVSLTHANGSRHLYLVSEAATANATGVATVSVTPQVRTGYAASNAVRIGEAKAKFVLDRQSVSEQRVGLIFTSFSFAAIQTLEGSS